MQGTPLSDAFRTVYGVSPPPTKHAMLQHELGELGANDAGYEHHAWQEAVRTPRRRRRKVSMPLEFVKAPAAAAAAFNPSLPPSPDQAFQEAPSFTNWREYDGLKDRSKYKRLRHNVHASYRPDADVFHVPKAAVWVCIGVLLLAAFITLLTLIAKTQVGLSKCAATQAEILIAVRGLNSNRL